jgi:hypothetical protein
MERLSSRVYKSESLSCRVYKSEKFVLQRVNKSETVGFVSFTFFARLRLVRIVSLYDPVSVQV